MNDDRGPDVLGLIEVENHYVLRELVKTLAPLKRNYKIVHQDSPSDRGIDCALLYDADRLSLRVSSFHFVDAENTRDIVEAALECAGHPLHVFVNHWPSRSSNPESHRITAAKTLRRRLDEILKLDPQADVAGAGRLERLSDQRLDQGASEDGRGAAAGHRRRVLQLHVADPPGAARHVRLSEQVGRDRPRDRLPRLAGQPAARAGRADRRRRCCSTSSSFNLPPPGMIARPNRSYSGDKFHATGISDHLPWPACWSFNRWPRRSMLTACV